MQQRTFTSPAGRSNFSHNRVDEPIELGWTIGVHVMAAALNNLLRGIRFHLMEIRLYRISWLVTNIRFTRFQTRHPFTISLVCRHIVIVWSATGAPRLWREGEPMYV